MNPKVFFPGLIILFSVWLVGCGDQSSKIHVYGNPDNDLYRLLVKAGVSCRLHQDAEEALTQCPDRGTLLLLAGAYPENKTMLPEGFYQRVQAKALKALVEFPDYLPADKTGPIKETKKERLVVNSGFFDSDLQPMQLLDAGLFSYVEVPERPALLRAANVAGFDRAVYGLEDTPSFPILFEEGNILVTTTKLSDFVKSRYSPLGAWRQIVQGILAHLEIELEDETIDWQPLVHPTYAAAEKLPADAYALAVERGAGWYRKGRFLIHPEWKDLWRHFDTLALPVGPPMDLRLPSGDGSLGIMEGHYSYIRPDGSQPYRYWLRADCVAEAAMTMAVADRSGSAPEYAKIAENLMNFLYESDTFRTPESRDPENASFGLIGWAGTRKGRYYGDDNARVILGSILAAQSLEKANWDRQILEAILANFRTAGVLGFRSNALNGNDVEAMGWQALSERENENPAPHYESWLWAVYLWLYDKTAYQPLLHKAKRAIERTMSLYPDGWIWTNGIQQERARMLLPLAWLVRVENIPQHRSWLEMIADDLLKNQVACGALREELGAAKRGKYGAPPSNAAYGHSEAPVIHSNGETVADMLYTSNFAFFALHEAARATGEPKYLEAIDRLADFLVRIQSSTSGREDLDGCWFRAFDYGNWEYYGSNADHGWGAWGTLTGWTQSFITTTLALKIQGSSYWEITETSSVGKQMEPVRRRMLPGLEESSR